MAKKILKGTIKIRGVDPSDKLTEYQKVTEVTNDGTLIAIFAPHLFATPGRQPVIMIDNDPAQRYTVALQDILEALAMAGFKEKLKGERKNGNTGRD